MLAGLMQCAEQTNPGSFAFVLSEPLRCSSLKKRTIFSGFPRALENLENLENGWPIFQSWKTHGKWEKKVKCPGKAWVVLENDFSSLCFSLLCQWTQTFCAYVCFQLSLMGQTELQRFSASSRHSAPTWCYQPIKLHLPLEQSCFPVISYDFAARFSDFSETSKDLFSPN